MTGENKGVISITTDEKDNNQKKVIFAPVDGTVWLTKNELTELFGVYTQTVNACIEAILRDNVFYAEDNCKCNLVADTGKNKIRYEPYGFNLMFIIAMAFRIHSPNAKVLRKWILEQLISPKLMDIHLPAGQRHQWN